MRSILPTVALAILAMPAAAQTIQQDYEAAQKALDARDVAGARAKFDALLKRMPAGSKSRSAAVVKARLGATLVMDGEQEAAVPLLTEAMAVFSTGTPEDLKERAEAQTDRGRAHEALGQFADAAADYSAVYEQLKPAPGTPADILLQSAMGRTMIWSDPLQARRILDRLIALPPETWGEDKRTIALIHSLRGRVELNDGKPEDAMRHFTRAMTLAGGSATRRVDLTDVRVRADAAIAAYLLGRTEAQQKLVAFSGGGSLVTQGLSSAEHMDLPQCGPSSGLDPADVVVMEFTIHDDGRVRAAHPIYAKRADGKRPDGRGDGPETQFVQAARSWYWKPDSLAKLDPFWRQALRAEVRCSDARPKSDLVLDSIYTEVAHSHDALGIRPMPPVPGIKAVRLPSQKAELQARMKADGPQSVQLVAPLHALIANDSASIAERIGWQEKSIALLKAANADPGTVAVAEQYLAMLRASDAKNWDSAFLIEQAPVLMREVAARPNARVTQYLRLERAEALHGMRAPKDAEGLLQQIVATPEDKLGRVDPIRTAALLRLSNIAAARNDIQAAALALAATGLSPEQCSLVDVKPQVENARVSSQIFPEDARRWGSGGMTRVEYDIGTDGKPLNSRTVMAAPPFVFGPAAEKGALQLRYEPVFRPGSSVGCSGFTQNFRFISGTP